MLYIVSLKNQQKSPFYIAEFERNFDVCSSSEKSEINRTLYFAYQNSKKAETEFINFDDIIWANDVEAIVKTLKENGIKEFIISSNSTGMIRSIMTLEAQGCRLIGTTMVNRKNAHFDDKKIPAIKMIIL